MGRDMFLDKNVVPGLSKDADPGTCLTWQNPGDLYQLLISFVQLKTIGHVSKH